MTDATNSGERYIPSTVFHHPELPGMAEALAAVGAISPEMLEKLQRTRPVSTRVIATGEAVVSATAPELPGEEGRPTES